MTKIIGLFIHINMGKTELFRKQKIDNPLTVSLDL